MCKALSAVVATDFLIGDEGEVDGADRLESRSLEAANRFQVLEADAFHVLGAPGVDVTGGAIDLGAKRRVRPLVRLGRDDVGVGFRLRDYEIRRFFVPWLGLGGVDSEQNATKDEKCVLGNHNASNILRENIPASDFTFYFPRISSFEAANPNAKVAPPNTIAVAAANALATTKNNTTNFTPNDSN
nr:hypothetical protein C4D60_Mb03t03480 [Ipomoea batatas]